MIRVKRRALAAFARIRGAAREKKTSTKSSAPARHAEGQTFNSVEK
jgi:hypothetical protein